MAELIDLTIDDMAAGGRGLAFHNGKPVFVPFTIPGERVRVRLAPGSGKTAEAVGVQLVEASADRVYPLCPHFGPGRCRGCQWQHINPAVQSLLKADIVADQLSRAAGLSDRELERVLRPAIAAPAPWGYNRAITFTVGEDGTWGLPAAEDGRPIPISACPITDPDVMALRDQLDLDLTGIKRVRLELDADDTALVTLWIATEDDAPELEADFPASVNLLLPDNEPMNLIGDAQAYHVVRGRRFRVTAGGFFRPNAGALSGLVAATLALLDVRASDALLDLYAGAGVFGAFMAETAALVTLVESYPPVATDADENTAEFEHVEVIEGGVEAVLPELEEQYDAALIDPPSSGLSEDAAAALAELAPQRIVYLSSDPATLARDAKRLIKAGYALTAAQPIDMAPQTAYIETIARFDKRRS